MLIQICHLKYIYTIHEILKLLIPEALTNESAMRLIRGWPRSNKFVFSKLLISSITFLPPLLSTFCFFSLSLIFLCFFVNTSLFTRSKEKFAEQIRESFLAKKNRSERALPLPWHVFCFSTRVGVWRSNCSPLFFVFFPTCILLQKTNFKL